MDVILSILYVFLRSKENEKHIERPHRWIKKIELEHKLDETLQDREYEIVFEHLFRSV